MDTKYREEKIKWALVISPRYDVPHNAKRVKLSVTVKGDGPQYVHSWLHFYDKDGRNIQTSTAGSFYIDAIDNSTLDDFKTITKVGDVPVSNPAFSTSYQKYVASGTKGQQWGTFVIYFKNNGPTPLEVTVKNITLSRVG